MAVSFATCSFANINYVSVEYCRPTTAIFFGRNHEKRNLETMNKKLFAALNKANAKTIRFVSYTNIETLFRSKKSGCIYATAWFDK